MAGCEHLSRVAAYHDGEMEPAAVLAFKAHLAACPVCAMELSELRRMSGLFGGLSSHRMPASALARAHRAIDDEPDPRSNILWVGGLLAGLAASALIIGAAWLWEMPGPQRVRTVVVIETPSGSWEQVAAGRLTDALPRGTWEAPDHPMLADARVADWMLDNLKVGGRDDSKATVVLILMCVLAAGAGVVAGKLSARTALPPPPLTVRASLSEELRLTPDQREQMRKIWETARDSARQCAADAQQFQRDYDDSINRLLTPDQQARYKELSDEAKRKTQGLEARRRAAFQQAVERTNQILDGSERATYEQIIRSRVGSTGAGPGFDSVPEDVSAPPATH